MTMKTANVESIQTVIKEKELLFTFKNPRAKKVRLFFRDVKVSGGVVDAWAMKILLSLNSGEVPLMVFSRGTSVTLLNKFREKYPDLAARYTMSGVGANKRARELLKSIV